MFFLFSFFDHLRFLTAAAQRRGLRGDVGIGSMNAVLCSGERKVEFLAQFLIRRNDGLRAYTMEYRDDVLGFTGWLPYFNKRWPEGADKLAFKRRCAEQRLPTPAWSLGCVAGELGDFIVKPAHASFGHGIRGPFVAAAAQAMPVGADDYAERYVEGQVGKVWYWNDAVVALELRPQTFVVGDGHSTLAQLVRAGRRSADVETVSDYFRYRGLGWQDVPAAEEHVPVDFKYGSPYAAFSLDSANRLHELQDGALVAQLRQWGPVFWQWVPEQLRAGVLYAVDFVLAQDGTVWLLEMNCNPAVPPEAYEAIVDSAFALDASAAAPHATAMEHSGVPPVPTTPMPAPGPVPGRLPQLAWPVQIPGALSLR
jgi:hypothetical protein